MTPDTDDALVEPVDETEEEAAALRAQQDAATAAEQRRAEVSATGVNLDKVRRLRELTQERDRHKERAEALGPEITKLNDEIIEEMAASGQTDIALDGVRAVPSMRTWGSRRADVDDETYYEAFRLAGEGWSDLVQDRINAQTLSARLSQWEAAHPGPLSATLPPELADVLHISDVYKVTFRKATTTRASRRVVGA